MNTEERTLPEETCPSCRGASVVRGVTNGECVYTCSDCGLWHYDERVRTRAPTDEDWYRDPAMLAPDRLSHYREQMSVPFDRQIAILERLAKGRTLLDVGCGVGLFLSVAKARGWQAHGLEKNTGAMQAAFEAFGLRVLDSHESIEDGSIDVMRFSHVLEHVPFPHAFIEPLLKKLIPSGVIMAIVPNVHPFCCSAVNAVRKMIRASGNLAAPMAPGHHIIGFTDESLRRLFEGFGFETVELFNVSMGNRTYFPLFYDGLLGRQRLTDIDSKTLLRYWLPMAIDNLGNPFGRGQWIVGYFRAPQE